MNRRVDSVNHPVVCQNSADHVMDREVSNFAAVSNIDEAQVSQNILDAAREVAKMPDQWEFMSHTYDNCNCSVSCGCQFNEPTTHGNCHFAYVGTIVEGHFNDTSLAGLNWSLLASSPVRLRMETLSARS